MGANAPSGTVTYGEVSGLSPRALPTQDLGEAANHVLIVDGEPNRSARRGRPHNTVVSTVSGWVRSFFDAGVMLCRSNSGVLVTAADRSALARSEAMV